LPDLAFIGPGIIKRQILISLYITRSVEPGEKKSSLIVELKVLIVDYKKKLLHTIAAAFFCVA